MTRICQALGLSRATYYRWQEVGPQPDQDMELRAQVQESALEMPAYGYRRITHCGGEAYRSTINGCCG